jgi:hypothetical protein
MQLPFSRFPDLAKVCMRLICGPPNAFVVRVELSEHGHQRCFLLIAWVGNSTQDPDVLGEPSSSYYGF